MSIRASKASGPYVGSDLFGASPYSILSYSGSTITPNLYLGNRFSMVLTQNTTLANPLNPANGRTMIVRLEQGGAGSYTISFGTKFRFSLALPAPTLSTAIGNIDYLGFIYHELDDKWDYIAEQKGFS